MFYAKFNTKELERKATLKYANKDFGLYQRLGYIEGMTEQNEHKERAINLLKNVLLESDVENEFDREIYEFLEEIEELPEGYEPYWE